MSNKFKQILQKISESPKNNSQMSKKHNNINSDYWNWYKL